MLLPGGSRPACLHIEAGKFAEIAPIGHSHPGVDVYEAGELPVLPGLVDSHVHVNQPGRTEWEGFASATRAAMVGGTTTIVDMPLNSIPPTVSVEALDVKRAGAGLEVRSDVAFWGGLVPDNLDQLEPMAEAGVCGFKAFLVDSGVPEFPPVDLQQIRDALEVLARLGLPLLVHAEDPAHIHSAPDGNHYVDYLRSRAPEAEEEAVLGLIDAAADTGGHVHVLHLASAGALPAISMAKERGVGITAETCPHYLFFSSEEVPDGATQFKCAPPIRDRSHQDGLWGGLSSGTLDMVVSDHSPAPPELKAVESGDFGAAWGGISSVQLRLAVTWTAARDRGWALENLVPKLALAPAALAGLAGRKGAIAVGMDADLLVFDPDAGFIVDPTTLEHRHPLTPYGGRSLTGVAGLVVLRGEPAGPLTAGLLLPGPRATASTP